MEMNQRMKVVLMADDDKDDVFLASKAFAESGLSVDFRSVSDGEELLDYLFCRSKYNDPKLFPEPSLILLDLNMPKKGGKEALTEIKADQILGNIPVVVYTTSSDEMDVRQCHELGINSFVTKPDSFEAMVNVFKTIAKYWLETVELPCHNPSNQRGKKCNETLGPEVLEIDKRCYQNPSR
jgi:CheY-like chemotaxis protein